jgi:hypothetical protein
LLLCSLSNFITCNNTMHWVSISVQVWLPKPPLHDLFNVQILSIKYGYRESLFYGYRNSLGIRTTYSTCTVVEAPGPLVQILRPVPIPRPIRIPRPLCTDIKVKKTASKVTKYITNQSYILNLSTIIFIS